jgi:RelA/SpoT family (p)ppGpp synthetase
MLRAVPDSPSSAVAGPRAGQTVVADPEPQGEAASSADLAGSGPDGEDQASSRTVDQATGTAVAAPSSGGAPASAAASGPAAGTAASHASSGSSPAITGGRRLAIHGPDDYGIPLPAWLAQCVRNVPPGAGEICPTDTEALLAAAFDFAYQLHDGQFRASGEPYIIHPVAVADLLREIGASAAVIAAGFLHDVVEDTQVTPEDIEDHFGAEVRALVEGVTKLGGIHFTNKTEAQAENLRRMFLAMASDIRVVLVKLADRLHNMRTLSALKPEKQQRIARETREIYAPLANRLGIGRFKWELEDLAFKILEPEAFREVQQQVATKRSEREQRLGVTVQLLRDRLAAAGLDHCDVSGRPKHLYGIWHKMQRQQKAFHEIYDVAALRILCPNLESCYRALAVVHDTFRPIPGRFKDYIGLPKPNGYQSLHTAVIGRHRPVEVQIRTGDMHQVAEYGIAAHWKYKEGGSPASGDAERFNWLRQLVEWQKEDGGEDSSDFLRSIKEDLFDEEVFVFTPNGDVVGLRKGSTAVDFAYRIHSEVGNHCHGVRINDRLCPLPTPLRNGDFVQILTSKSAHPSLDWLNFVATPTARNRIRQWYKRSHREDNILRGTAMLERELGRDGFDALLHGEAMARVARRCNLVGTEDLLAAIGFGGVTLQQALNRLREELRLASAGDVAPLSNEELARSVTAQAEASHLPAQRGEAGTSPILGLEGLEYRLGGCCSPLPGEAIVGSVALGNHGITIHRQDCANLGQVPAERRLPVRWNPLADDQRRRYTVQLRIEVLDRVGVLKDILTRLSDHRINVSDARVRTNPGKPARIDLRVELLSAAQLRDTIDQIGSMADVLDIARTGIG